MTTEENDDDGFRRVYELLGSLVDAVNEIRKRHAMVLAGPELITLVAIENEESDLGRDVHLLERQLRSHQV